ncbi:hypothetical protein [Kutzneria sp. NPDC051319]|uniref:hypothetical protein n=1 Tax=Kutzneria sp. NPDC051319 TaxID=3155047 RepID=UPI0034466ACA
MSTTTVTIHGDLEAAFTAARATALAAIGDDDSDYPAWCRQVAAARRVTAEVYAAARDSLPTGGLLWHAVNEAADAQRDRAKHLERIADRHEQEGTSR